MIEDYEKEPLLKGFHVTDVIIDEYRQNLIKANWPAHEAVHKESMHLDRKQFDMMDSDERYFIITTLILFLISDDYVDDIIEDELLSRIKNRIWKGYETQKKANEDVHSETYRLLLEYLVPGKVDEYAEDIKNNYTFITDKINWCQRSMGRNDIYNIKDENKVEEKPVTLAHCIFIMTIIESLFFSTSFATIFWYKSKNMLPGIAYANEIIARDEGSHSMFDIYIYNTLKHKLSPEEAKKIMLEAIEIECNFISTITPTRLGINKELLCDYARYMGNEIMVNMGYEPVNNVLSLPISYMADFGIRRKVDFFRKKDNQYQAFIKVPINNIVINVDTKEPDSDSDSDLESDSDSESDF